MLLESIPPVDEILQDAERFLAEGKWRKAERQCEEILRHEDHPKAAYLLGQVYLARGQAKRALEFFQRVVAWEPENAQAHFSYASLLLKRDPQAAAQSWIAGLEIDPTFLPAHLGLSDALLALGLHDAAIIAAKQALLVEAENADALDRWARASEMADSRLEAIQALRAYSALRPESAAPLQRLAVIYERQGDLDESQRLLERAVQLEPRRAGLRFEYSQILAKQGARGAANQQLREAVRLQPHFPEAFSNIGMFLRADRRFQEAENAYKKACSQNPEFAPAWNNLANLYMEQVRLDDAERCYSKAIKIAADYGEAHTGRAMLRLLRGRFEEGWAEYEWRWQQRGQRRRDFEKPEWDGSSLEGRTILLHSEQGAGDTIQFIRYARLLKKQGARVVLHCPASMRTLMETMRDVDQVLCGKETLPAFDVHAPLMSLPRLCRTDLTNLPSETPYLAVLPNEAVPEALLKTDKLRVGLVWAGNPAHHNDRNRSMPSQLLQTLLRTEGVQFFSLQLGGEPMAESDVCMPAFDLAPFLSSYAVTAACLQNIDLLITVDTSVAHLAGALGRPVWMMLPACNDWRWLLGRTDSPWYPTMQIFRQDKPGDWSDVLQRVETACAALAAEKRS